MTGEHGLEIGFVSRCPHCTMSGVRSNRERASVMIQPNESTTRAVALPDSGLRRFLTASGRAVRRCCPYCGAGHIFAGWFTLKERCPGCHTLYAYEDGYFLGAYAINLVVTELLTVAAVIWMIAGTDMSVPRMQLAGISLAVALPLLFYPVATLLWVAIDLGFHPPGDTSGRPRH